MQLKELINSSFRIRYIWQFFFFFVSINFSGRFVYLFAFNHDFAENIGLAPLAILYGILNDIAMFCFAGLPMALLVFILPDRCIKHRFGRIILFLVLFVFTSITVFTSFAEYFFWDEFHTRLNFIAIDYLIYTNELIKNIIESYPVGWIFTGIGLLSAVLSVLLWKIITRQSQLNKDRTVEGADVSFGRRMRYAAITIFPAIALFFLFSPRVVQDNRYLSELSRNGMYEFFSAYFSNELDYRVFYPTMDDKQVEEIVSEMKRSSGTVNYVLSANAIANHVQPNVVLVIMESMGSKWYQPETAPNLMRLSKEGIYFAQMKSTGTRTVRGIEALTLSIPPTPGNSIVRRPDNDNLYSMGTLFKQRGYDMKFIYGGYGYFDNMNAFFRDNGYDIVDRTDFGENNKTYATAWGQCDEDLFNESLSQADAVYDNNKPFHQVLLTTSNHRPFNFPDSPVGSPDGSRTKAIKYSDYAIGEYIKKASQKPWFDNTIFLFVGDHPSSIAGGTSLPGENYGIIAIVYAPSIISPLQVDTLCSQIDVAPTLFTILGWDYGQRFFGKDILAMSPSEGRSWVSTYQLLGYMDTNGLVSLQPNGTPEIRPLAKEDEQGNSITYAFPVPDNSTWQNTALERCVASYQYAYDLFKSGGLKESAIQ